MKRVFVYKRYNIRFWQFLSCIQPEDGNLFHKHDWLQVFLSMHNDTIATKKECLIHLQEEMVNLSKINTAQRIPCYTIGFSI